MAWTELGVTWGEAGLTVVTATGIYLAMIALSRVFGQRQFSTSSTYDLAFIFALGSLVGRVVLIRTSLLDAVIGLATMFVLHAATGWLHHNIPAVHRLIQNRPVLVLANGRILADNLDRAHTSRLELHQALRLQGVCTFDEVRAAVLERNGSISVIVRGDHVDDELFADVIGREQLGANAGSP